MYSFAILYLASMLCVYRLLWPFRLWWLLVCCLYKEVYLQFFNVYRCDYTAVAGSGKVGPVNQVNHTSWVAVVTPTNRSKSVRNRCVIELFCGVVCIVTLPLWHFCWCRGFFIGLSQISVFFYWPSGMTFLKYFCWHWLSGKTFLKYFCWHWLSGKRALQFIF